ncbi:threonine synthase [Gigaspora margarita]|uniref:threonine synthase n=1 Tax=Gigaspora margarita TaxID=4874 RepID=A0A8H4ADA1_GIGMA|nr:threonine synthase [Gigaspora margarita]
MKYFSTRGSPDLLTFSEVVLIGLSKDGGLFIPQTIPTLPSDWKTAWLNHSFTSLALEIFSLYIPDNEIPRKDLECLINKSYSTFRESDITPLKKIKENFYILELFHGPTFAFKDVALQFLGNLFEYLLEKKNLESLEKKDTNKKERITILGATSGDTGSAAIYGLRNKKDISVFILHPRGKVSPVQEAQMTTVLDKNVHNIAVEGTFDDCQDIVKTLFSDNQFNQKHNLGAINSINWARILAQIVYYFHSYFQLFSSLNILPNSPEANNIKFQYCVPTGNFGDILAGYYAKHMGLPIENLVVATNSNDILDRFFKTGRYEKIVKIVNDGEGNGIGGHTVYETLSPAMDISISSNFERLLWYLAYESIDTKSGKEKINLAGSIVKKWMDDLKSKQCLTVERAQLELALRDFKSDKISDQETMETIRRYYVPQDSRSQISYVLDPHTAVGVAAADRQKIPSNMYQICLSTAHPAKFSAAVEESLKSFSEFKFQEILPKEFVGLLEKEKRCVYIEKADPEMVKKTIECELEKEFI